MSATPTSEGRRTRLAEQRTGPARRARRLPVPRRARARSSTSARPSRSASASPATSPIRVTPRRLRDGRRDRVGRVPARRLRGRGAAGRAELHQAVPAALQHPPARRQVLSVHRDLDGRGVPARLLHARAPPPRPPVLRPVLERQARARRRSTCSARSSCSAPARAPSPGRRVGLAVPGLLHQALRGALRRLRRRGGVPRVDRRRHRLPLGPLPRDRARPRAAHEATPRPRRSSSRRRSSATACARCASLLERQRVANESVGTLDAVAVAVDGDGRQRPGLPGPRRRALRPPVVLPRQRGRARRSARSPRSSSCSTTATQMSIPRAGHRPERGRGRARRSARRSAERRGAPRRGPRGRARRQAPDPRARRAQRAARARPGEA